MGYKDEWYGTKKELDKLVDAAVGGCPKKKRTQGKRNCTKIVPKFFRNRNMGDNMNNTNNKNH